MFDKAKADFSGMLTKKHVSKVQHKHFTEAREGLETPQSSALPGAAQGSKTAGHAALLFTRHDKRRALSSVADSLPR